MKNLRNPKNPLEVSADMMYNALKVFLHSEKLRPLLEVNDKKAFDQATQACSYHDALAHFPVDQK